MSSSKVIEITIISAEDLLINRSQAVKKNAFAVVKTDTSITQSTGVDKECGNQPYWNQKLIMNLPMNARSFNVEVHSGSTVIGSADIPVSDFSGGYFPDGYLSCLSYRLRDAKGNKNGIVNLSVKVQGNRGTMGCSTSSSSQQPWMAVPMDSMVSGMMATRAPYV